MRPWEDEIDQARLRVICEELADPGLAGGLLLLLSRVLRGGKEREEDEEESFHLSADQSTNQREKIT